MPTVFVRYTKQHFYDICKVHFESRGYTMVEALSADIAIIDLDHPDSYPDMCDAKLVVLTTARVMFYLREGLPPHDVFWEKPFDAEYMLNTLTNTFVWDDEMDKIGLRDVEQVSGRRS